MKKLLGLPKSNLFIITIVYIIIVLFTSLFLWLPNRGLSRFINQIPIFFLIAFFIWLIKRKFTISDKIYFIILVGSPVVQFISHFVQSNNHLQLAVIIDMVFILTVHSLLIVVFRYEGGVVITAGINDLKVTFPILTALLLIFGTILMNYIPNQYVIVFVIFIGIAMILTATFINRKVIEESKRISEVGVVGILSCDFIALYSKFVYKFPYSFECYRASYFIGIYFIIIGSLINTEHILNKKSKSKDLHLKA